MSSSCWTSKMSFTVLSSKFARCLFFKYAYREKSPSTTADAIGILKTAFPNIGDPVWQAECNTCPVYILCGTIQHAGIRSGEFLSYIPRGVGAFGLLLSARTQCVLALKSKPNTHTPPTIWDKNSPNSVSCRIGFSTLYPSSRGQTGQLQDQWPWWQRTFLGRVSPKSHGVCACLRPSDPRSP